MNSPSRSRSVTCAFVAAALVGCAVREPSRPTGDTEGAKAPGEMVAGEAEPTEIAPDEPQPAAEKSPGGCRFFWKLPAGRRVRYACKATTEGSGRMAMKGNITLNVDITAAEDGLALVDTSLSEASIKVGERGMPAGMLAQAYEIHCLLEAEKGFDPHGAIPRQQRNVFEMFFPLPYREAKIGEEWPLKIQMLSLGPGATVKESSVAALAGITGEPGARTAKIAMRSATSVASEAGKAGGVMNMNMSVTGSAEFDLSAGYFKSNALSASMSMPAMPFPGGPEPKGMEMKVALEVKLAECGTLDAEELARASKVLATRKAVAKAVTLARAGKNAEALATLGDGPLKAGIPEEHPHLIAAQIHAGMGNWQEAKDAIEKEVELCPGNPQVIQVAGAIYLRSGDKAKAEEMQKKLRDLMMGGAGRPPHLDESAIQDIPSPRRSRGSRNRRGGRPPGSEQD